MSYINFEEEFTNTKTRKFVILNNNDTILGKIKWFSHWRRYCFFPELNTIWDSNCLHEIMVQIDLLMEERK